MTSYLDPDYYKDFRTIDQTHNSYPNRKNLVVKVVGRTVNDWSNYLSTNQANPNDNFSRNVNNILAKLIQRFQNN